MPDDGETFARRDPERAKGLRCLFAGSSRIVRRAYLLRSTLMLRLLLCLGLGLIVSVPVSPAQTVLPPGLQKLDHIVVIYLENRSFDNLFGLFPGADGLQNAWK